MKYRLLKPLPGVEVGYIYNEVKKLDIARTDDEKKIDEFVKVFGLYNDFFEPIKESKWWDPKEGEYCYVINGERGKYQHDEIHNATISAGLAFKTEEEAEKQLKIMQAITRCKRYLVERDMLLSSEDIMNDGIKKSTVMYKIGTGFLIEAYDTYIQYSPYGHINSKENAKKFIKDCQEDLLLIHKPC